MNIKFTQNTLKGNFKFSMFMPRLEDVTICSYMYISVSVCINLISQKMTE